MVIIGLTLSSLGFVIVAASMRTIADPPARPDPAGVGDHGVHDHLHDRDAAVRQAMGPVAVKAAVVRGLVRQLFPYNSDLQAYRILMMAATGRARRR
ncbi:hypothetical protein CJD44_01385 [Streptomyces sp. alain-838]|nr:hypothetical protein CJD44_01385 [Streptomyces sp. alain-838]